MKEKNLITAERIKQCRLSADETLEQVGNLIGVHKTTVRRWETGETDRIALSTIQTLALHYNVSPAWLMGADVPMEREENDVERTEKKAMGWDNKKGTNNLSDHEQKLIIAYRQNTSMQEAVDRLLSIEPEDAEVKKQA